MPPSQQFQYQPLGSARSTRLITLFPAPASQRDSEIIIELSECALESTIEYEALSYTWGDQQPSRDITCNGAMLRVTENVHLALRRLRSDQGQQRTLWIDALSINQQDEAEKTAQVSEMGLIYTRAKRVNVWLGYPTEVMVKFFDLVDYLNVSRLQAYPISDSGYCWIHGCAPPVLLLTLLDENLDHPGSRPQQ
ncbi:hypothetical protein PG991_014906 [Apiospora marii]|uniref:Heterokaryon incompatibility domain-containing protein n=1 Tax=Apiospora marii TaxID=335849 RepID=A0ABR1R5K6_9PEZI